MIQPKPLKQGDRLAVLCGSSPTSKTPEQLTAAVRAMGLEPVLYKTATAVHGYFCGDDALRAADINAAFADDSIKGIVTTRGGYGFHRILPLLDWKMIAGHPKRFGGYSDVTAMLNSLNKIADMEAYHMPMIGAWSDGMDDYTMGFVRSMLFDEPVDYVNPDKAPIPALNPGKAEGRLCGGNLSLVAASLGTPYEIDTKGKILFLEDVGEKYYRIDSMLTQLRNAGKFEDASGILLGAFSDCAADKAEKESLSLEQVYDELIVPAKKPTLCGVVCGHINTSMSLPMGREFCMDADAGTFGPAK